MKSQIDSGRQRRQNMNWDEAGSNWEAFKKRVQERWQWLSEDQVGTIAGRRERLSQELQRTYGLSPGEAEAEIEDFESGGETVAGASSGRGPTEQAREFGSGNETGATPHDDKHHLH